MGDGLICGSNNCPVSLGFLPEVDCCNCCKNVILSHSSGFVQTIYQNLYGTYSADGTDSHNRQYYLHDDGGNYAIWWCNEDENWIIGHATNRGTCSSWYASANKVVVVVVVVKVVVVEVV